MSNFYFEGWKLVPNFRKAFEIQAFMAKDYAMKIGTKSLVLELCPDKGALWRDFLTFFVLPSMERSFILENLDETERMVA
jgi:hypothetical protein